MLKDSNSIFIKQTNRYSQHSMTYMIHKSEYQKNSKLYLVMSEKLGW